MDGGISVRIIRIFFELYGYTPITRSKDHSHTGLQKEMQYKVGGSRYGKIAQEFTIGGKEKYITGITRMLREKQEAPHAKGALLSFSH